MLVWYLALRTCCLKASSVGVKCEAGLAVIEARKYRRWFSEQQFLVFIPYKLRTSKRADRTYSSGVYLDVTLPVDCWCVMACQHVHNFGEHTFIAYSHCCMKWWYWCFGGYHTTAVRTCSPSLCTCCQAITHQRSTGNVTFLHPFHCCIKIGIVLALHCCRTWCQVLWKCPNTTCTYKMWQYKQFIPNRKMCLQHSTAGPGGKWQSIFHNICHTGESLYRCPFSTLVCHQPVWYKSKG
jgi:hypothetical protein